jgi:hypothetical protein
VKERASQSLRAAAVTLVAGLLLPGNAYAQDPQPVETGYAEYAAAGFDVVIVRPLGLVALAIGAVVFVPAAVITAPNGKDSLRAALEVFVTGPAHHVFQRPLGDF